MIEWTQWGKWSECSKTCGGGEQKRKRVCEVPKLRFSFDRKHSVCPGDDMEKRKCNKNPCPGELCDDKYWKKNTKKKPSYLLEQTLSHWLGSSKKLKTFWKVKESLTFENL